MAPALLRTPSSDTPDPPELVDALRRGDPLALRWTMETYQKPLLAFATKVLDGMGEAEDVVQEAFARFWRNRESLRKDGSIRALLYCTVRTLALDEQRRWGRRNRCRARFSCFPSVTSPMDELLESELNEMAERAIHDLPPRRKAIFRMVREEGLSHREAARTLGISPQTVSNTMTSAMADIRATLMPVLEEAS